ncbi:MAG: hypothetical protein ACJ8C4_15235 [Gemmataceae bacterium]
MFNRHVGVTGAELSLAHMGMSDRFVAGGRVRLQSHDIEATDVGRSLQPFPMKLDGKGAEVNSFKMDRLSRDTEVLLPPLYFDCTKLILQLRQFPKVVTGGIHADQLRSRCGGNAQQMIAQPFDLFIDTGL